MNDKENGMVANNDTSNENGFVEKAEYKNGSLVINSNNVPEWLKEFEQLLNNNMI